jgi:hypothetical protein
MDILTLKKELYDIFQILPLDIIDIIYNLKLSSENEDAREWHQLCPRHIPNPPKWIPVNINDNHKIFKLKQEKKQLRILLKCLSESEFIHDEQVPYPELPLCKKIRTINNSLVYMTSGVAGENYSTKKLLKQYNRYKRYQRMNNSHLRNPHHLVII